MFRMLDAAETYARDNDLRGLLALPIEERTVVVRMPALPENHPARRICLEI